MIRTLGFWQPYGSLMLRGKIETRVVEVGRKPPFPLGEYLFYTTHKSTDSALLLSWCGEEIMNNMMDVLVKEPTFTLNGYAIATAKLVSIRPMTADDENKCFIKYFGTTEKIDKSGKVRYYHQNCLIFEDIKRIDPFKFEFGKQGVGIANEKTIKNLQQ